MQIIVISLLSCNFVCIFFCSLGFSSEIDEDYEKTRRNIVTKYDRVSFMQNINNLFLYYYLVQINRILTIWTGEWHYIL